MHSTNTILHSYLSPRSTVSRFRTVKILSMTTIHIGLHVSSAKRIVELTRVTRSVGWVCGRSPLNTSLFNQHTNRPSQFNFGYTSPYCPLGHTYGCFYHRSLLVPIFISVGTYMKSRLTVLELTYHGHISPLLGVKDVYLLQTLCPSNIVVVNTC